MTEAPAGKPEVTVFFEPESNTVTAVVRDPAGQSCAVVDTVMGFNYSSGCTNTTHVDQVLAFIQEKGYVVEWILETHAHADHLSAAPYVKKKMGGRIAIGEHIKVVQEVFAGVFGLGEEFKRDGSQFDHLFKDGETFSIGTLTASVLHTPGHTPACICYHIGDALFCGDTIFMPDYGTARCDFPGGSSKTMYASIQKILKLPDEIRMFVGHDYLPKDGRTTYAWETTVGEQRKKNIHVSEAITEDAFMEVRDTRDATLAVPKAIIPSVQVNIRAGNFPDPEASGNVYLKVPLNVLSNTGTVAPK